MAKTNAAGYNLGLVPPPSADTALTNEEQET